MKLLKEFSSATGSCCSTKSWFKPSSWRLRRSLTFPNTFFDLFLHTRSHPLLRLSHVIQQFLLQFSSVYFSDHEHDAFHVGRKFHFLYVYAFEVYHTQQLVDNSCL